MNLIPNANQWWKMFSVQALLAIGVIQAILANLPPETLQSAIAGTFTVADIGKWASIALAIVGAIGRVIDQQLGATPPQQ
jgi:steroid 5-alpha reductase family enzyme